MIDIDLFKQINDNACTLAGRLFEQVDHAFTEDKLKGKVSLSIGIAIYPDHGKSFDELFKASDKAMYYVKQHGRHELLTTDFRRMEFLCWHFRASPRQSRLCDPDSIRRVHDASTPSPEVWEYFP